MIFSLFTNYKSTSDEQLMKRVRLMNDEKAFNELHRRYARLLQGFFFRRLGGDEQQAADLLQETFVRVWTSCTSYSASQPFRTWLFSVAYNLCKNTYRSNQRKQAYLESLSTEEPIEEETTTIQLDAVTFDQALQQALSCLHESQQLLFELRFTQELTVPEIAVIIGIPEGTVKSRLYTLTNHLRLKLKDYE